MTRSSSKTDAATGESPAVLKQKEGLWNLAARAEAEKTVSPRVENDYDDILALRGYF